MRVAVDRLNGCVTIHLADGPVARRVEVGTDVTASLDRFGRLQQVYLGRPFAPEIRRQVLPRLADQFHVPELRHLDPAVLMRAEG